MSAREQTIMAWAKALTHEQAIDALVELTEYAIDTEGVNLSRETEVPYWDSTGDPVVAGQRPFDDD